MKNIIGLIALLPFLGCGPSNLPKKDTLVLAWESAPRNLDPRYSTDANSQYLNGLLHCSLVTFDQNGTLKGQLAERFHWKNATTLSFKIKKGIRFSDGSVLNVRDIKATYDFFSKKNLKNPSPRRGAFSQIEKITLAGSDQIDFKLKEPDVPFLTNLVIGILPEKIAQGPMIRDVKNSIGCGAFQLKEKSVTSVHLKPNPHYNLSQPSKLKGIEIKIVQDENTRYAKLRKGELDLVQNLISRDKLKGLTDHGLKLTQRPGLNAAYLGFNFKDPLTGNLQVRKAIQLAIDRKAIIDHVLFGMAVPARTLLPPTDFFFHSKLPEPKAPNLTEAKKILDQAGLTDPDQDGPKVRFRLSYKTTTNITRVTIAKAIASQLLKIGIGVDVQSLEWGKFKSDVEKGNIQIWSLNWIGFKDPDIYRYTFGSENFPPMGGNRGWYSNPKLDKLLQAGKKEPDRTKRKRIYQKIQNIVSEELPYVFLWHNEIFAVLQPHVKGFQLYADGRLSSLYQTVKE